MAVEVGAGSVPWRALSNASLPAATALVRSPLWLFRPSLTPCRRWLASSPSSRAFSPSCRRVSVPVCGARSKATPAPTKAPRRNAVSDSELWSLMVIPSRGDGAGPEAAPFEDAGDERGRAGAHAAHQGRNPRHRVDHVVDDHGRRARDAASRVGEFRAEPVHALRHVAQRVEHLTGLEHGALDFGDGLLEPRHGALDLL